MKSSRYFISVYYRRLNRKRECKFASVEWIFLNGSLILRIAAVIGTAFPTRWNHVFIIELSLNKNNIWNIFFFGKERKKKKKDIKNLEFARFRESKIQSDRNLYILFEADTPGDLETPENPRGRESSRRYLFCILVFLSSIQNSRTDRKYCIIWISNSLNSSVILWYRYYGLMNFKVFILYTLNDMCYWKIV